MEKNIEGTIPPARQVRRPNLGIAPKGKEPAIAPKPKRKMTGLDDRPRAPTSSARYYPGYARIFFLLRYIFAWFDPKRFVADACAWVLSGDQE